MKALGVQVVLNEGDMCVVDCVEGIYLPTENITHFCCALEPIPEIDKPEILMAFPLARPAHFPVD